MKGFWVLVLFVGLCFAYPESMSKGISKALWTLGRSAEQVVKVITTATQEQQEN